MGGQRKLFAKFAETVLREEDAGFVGFGKGAGSGDWSGEDELEPGGAFYWTFGPGYMSSASTRTSSEQRHL